MRSAPTETQHGHLGRCPRRCCSRCRRRLCCRKAAPPFNAAQRRKKKNPGKMLGESALQKKITCCRQRALLGARPALSPLPQLCSSSLLSSLATAESGPQWGSRHHAPDNWPASPVASPPWSQRSFFCKTGAVPEKERVFSIYSIYTQRGNP